MPPSLVDQVRRPLDESEAWAVQPVADGALRTIESAGAAGEHDWAYAERRLHQLARVRADIERDRIRIDAACVRLAEGMAATCALLADAAREADFSAPPWPEPTRRTLEVKLSQTREVTLRFASGGPKGNGPGDGD